KPTGDDRTLIDLGCADGRLALRAAREGLNVIAYDKDRTCVEVAKYAADVSEHRHLIRVKHTDDPWNEDLTQADIIMVPRPERFGALPEVREQLQPKLLTLKDGVRIVST